MRSLLWLIDTVITLYVWLLIASAVLSWLIAFNVVNTRNRSCAQSADFLYRVTEPALRPIRRILPNLGGIDVSPIILILLSVFLRNRDLRALRQRRRRPDLSAMAARIIDGTAIAERLRARIAAAVAALARRSVRPGLAVVLVGEDPASQVYVRSKTRQTRRGRHALLRPRAAGRRRARRSSSRSSRRLNADRDGRRHPRAAAAAAADRCRSG